MTPQKQSETKTNEYIKNGNSGKFIVDWKVCSKMTLFPGGFSVDEAAIFILP